MTGMANTNSSWVTSIIQVNTGMRNRVIPGARMLRIVTVRLIDDISEATPVIWRPRA